MFKIQIIILNLILFLFMSCSSDNSVDNARVLFKLQFDPDQARLDNFGQLESVPEGNAAQTPRFNEMGVHYIELSEGINILAYEGTEIFNSPTTIEGGKEAIDFEQALYGADQQILHSVELKY